MQKMEQLENIVFEDLDSPQDIARKTVYLYAGSSALKNELKKLKIEYTKDNKGVFVEYYLKGKEIGKLTVRL